MKVVLKELLVHAVPQTMENGCISLRALRGKLEENSGLSLVPWKHEIKELAHQVVAELTTGCELGRLAAETLSALRDPHVGLWEPCHVAVGGATSAETRGRQLFTRLHDVAGCVSMACGDKSRDGCLMKGTFHIADSLRSCQYGCVFSGKSLENFPAIPEHSIDQKRLHVSGPVGRFICTVRKKYNMQVQDVPFDPAQTCLVT